MAIPQIAPLAHIISHFGSFFALFALEDRNFFLGLEG